MSKMAELDLDINEALDLYTGPFSWKSCEEIAIMLNVPLEMIHDVVENRWNEKVEEVNAISLSS